MKGRHQSRRLAHPAFGAISLDRAADPLGRGEADADQALAILAIPRLGDQGAARADTALGGGQEIRPLAQAFDDRRRVGDRLPRETGVNALGGQVLAAARATAGDDLLAILSGHARTKPMTALSHQPGWLKSPLHLEAPIDRVMPRPLK